MQPHKTFYTTVQKCINGCLLLLLLIVTFIPFSFNYIFTLFDTFIDAWHMILMSCITTARHFRITILTATVQPGNFFFKKKQRFYRETWSSKRQLRLFSVKYWSFNLRRNHRFTLVSCNPPGRHTGKHCRGLQCLTRDLSRPCEMSYISSAPGIRQPAM